MRWIKKSATTQHIAKHQDGCLLCSMTSWIYRHIMHVLYKLRPPVVPGINLTSCARLDQAKYAEQSTIPKWFECPQRPGI